MEIKIGDIVMVINWYNGMFGKVGRVIDLTDPTGYFKISFKDDEIIYTYYCRDLKVIYSKEI